MYVNQVVVPATPPLFVPTATATKSPESFVNQASDLFDEGKLTQAMEAYKEAIRVNPENPSNYINLARVQVWMGEYEEAVLIPRMHCCKIPTTLWHTLFRGGRWDSRINSRKPKWKSKKRLNWIRTMHWRMHTTQRFY